MKINKTPCCLKKSAKLSERYLKSGLSFGSFFQQLSMMLRNLGSGYLKLDPAGHRKSCEVGIRLKKSLSEIPANRLKACICVWLQETILQNSTLGHDSGQWRAEAVRCLGPTRFLDVLENILYSSRKIKCLTTFFSRSPKFFTFFTSFVKFHENSLLGCPPPVRNHAPVTTYFHFFFGHLPTFFSENWHLGCPPGWMPEAVAPSAHPLHATDSG